MKINNKLLKINWLLIISVIILVVVYTYINYKNYINLSESQKPIKFEHKFSIWP